MTGGAASIDTISATDTKTMTDITGNVITVPSQPIRVATLDRGPAEILSGLGVADSIVAIHQSLADDPQYPSLHHLPIAATWSEVNIEVIAQTHPNIVLSSVEGGHGTLTDNRQLAKFGITDIKTNLRDPRLMTQEITELGKLFNTEKRAEALTDFYETTEAKIRDRIIDIPETLRPKVFLQTHPGLLNTGGSDSAWFNQVELAGGINISEELTGLPEVDAEWVVLHDPDIIIVEGSTLGFEAVRAETSDASQLRDQVLHAPGLRETTAARNGAVYVIPTDLVSRPGYIVGVVYMAKLFFPDRFHDLDPEQIHREYLALFHPGVEYQGTWIYPDYSLAQ